MRTAYQMQIYIGVMAIIYIKGTKQDGDVIWRSFRAVKFVNVNTYAGALTRQVDGVISKLKCSTMCVEYGCDCVSFTYDVTNRTCHMFSKAITGGRGTSAGAIKVTECAAPIQVPNAALLTYTGCNATYQCLFGYNATAPTTLTCQSNETWPPAAFECTKIPCSEPTALSNTTSFVTSYEVGGLAVYSCIPSYINRGGSIYSLMCTLGGTWAGDLDIVCKPITILYDFMWTTANENFAGTGAKVYVTVYGSYGTITTNIPTTKTFEIGVSDNYQIIQADVGPPYRIDVGHDGTGGNPGWKLQSITIIMDGIGTFNFIANAWVEDPTAEISLYL